MQESITETTKQVIYGIRGDNFKNLIKGILKMGNLKNKYIEKLVNDENIKLYDIAFTSKSANPVNNYEFFEILGDATLGNFIIYYCARRFPELNNAEGVKTLSNMKAEYGKKQFLAQLAERFNFFEYITATAGEKTTPLQKTRNEKTRKDLLEDTFESFIGVTVYILDKEFVNGVGYAIAYNFLKEIYDIVEIKSDFQSLQHSITKLKEFFDPVIYSSIGKIDYITIPSIQPNIPNAPPPLVNIEVYFVSNKNKKIKLGNGSGPLKNAAKEAAAKNAMEFISKMGWTKTKAFDDKTLTFLIN